MSERGKPPEQPAPETQPPKEIFAPVRREYDQEIREHGVDAVFADLDFSGGRHLLSIENEARRHLKFLKAFQGTMVFGGDGEDDLEKRLA